MPEEWATLLESTMVAGIVVSAADPSGLWGTLKEFFANSSALDAEKRDPHSNELVRAVIEAIGATLKARGPTLAPFSRQKGLFAALPALAIMASLR